MKKSVFQKIVCLMLSVVMLFGAFVTSVFAFDEIVADENHGSAEGGYRPTLDEMKTYLDASSYAAYLEESAKLGEWLDSGLVPYAYPDQLLLLGMPFYKKKAEAHMDDKTSLELDSMRSTLERKV